MMPPPLANSVNSTAQIALPSDWRDFFALTKPRVMTLVVFTGLCGLLIAPVALPPVLGFASVLAIALGAGAAAALNQWYEADIDALMRRTAKRPLPDGRMNSTTALHFGIGLSAASMLLLWLASNIFATVLLAGSIAYYVLIYTVWLKRRTPQNIVIGGVAGAFPPLIGYAAAAGELAALPVILFLIVCLWTPPHSWALALFVKGDYARAGVPMMPVAAGERKTRAQIMLYSLAMAISAMLPWYMGLAGPLYGWTALILNAAFLVAAYPVAMRSTQGDSDIMRPEKRLFTMSLFYLTVIFLVIVVDRMMAHG
jgi:protoheme IX farnesyltransferase